MATDLLSSCDYYWWSCPTYTLRVIGCKIGNNSICVASEWSLEESLETNISELPPLNPRGKRVQDTRRSMKATYLYVTGVSRWAKMYRRILSEEKEESFRVPLFMGQTQPLPISFRNSMTVSRTIARYL